MRHIKIDELSHEEIGELYLKIATLLMVELISESEQDTICEHLYRDENGVAYARGLEDGDFDKISPIL